MSELQSTLTAPASILNPPISWMCRETKQRFSSTRAAAKHAGVTASTMLFAFHQGMKFYRSKSNGHTYLVVED